MRFKTLIWVFIKLKFKYGIISKMKLDYEEGLQDLEEFYDEVYEIWMQKYVLLRMKEVIKEES